MKVETFACDICGQIKGENNHWFRMCTGGRGLELVAWGVMPSTETTVDVCSDQCVTKVVQRWLNSQAETSSMLRSLEHQVTGSTSRRSEQNQTQNDRNLLVG